MSIGNDDFKYTHFDANKALKEEYFLATHFTPGLGEDVFRSHLLIYKDLSFEFKLVWWKYPLQEPILSIYKSNLLPEHIVATIHELDPIERLELKEHYGTTAGQYTPNDVSLSSIYLNHHGKTHSVNMSSYFIERALFQSDAEKMILKLYDQIHAWKEQLREGIMKLHE